MMKVLHILMRRTANRFGMYLVVQAAVLLLWSSLATAQERAETEPQILTFGVLATEGATRALEAWTPAIALLNQTARDQGLPYRFRIAPHSDTTLLQKIDAGEVDLILSDPATFVVAEVEEGARALVSAAQMWGDLAFDQTGALIFARADSAIQRYEDLEGKRLMGTSAQELTSWQLARQEIRKYRLDPEKMVANLLFSGGNQREVVYAVQSGLVDAGVIRAGVLETLAAEGTIDLADFRPIMPIAHEGYPFWVSTPLFPDWVISALPNVEEEALALIINTLLELEQGSDVITAAGGTVWQAPQNYQDVHQLLISLRVRPYENYLVQAATRIYRAYKLPVWMLLTLILGSILFLIYEWRRHVRLAEARKNVLESETRSKRFYRRAIEEHTVFCMLTKNGTISHVNDKMLAVLDRSRMSLLQSQLSEILSENNSKVMESQIMGSVHKGVPWQGALQLKRADSKAAWVQCTFIPVTGTSNELSEIAIVASDVTQTRKGVSETQFNNTLELIQDQVIVMRPRTFELMYVNSAANNLLIRERIGGSWKGRKASDFITAEDFEALRMRAEATIEGPQRRVTWEVEGKNDVTYEISLEYAQPDQEEPRLIAIYRDISERKIVEKAKNEFIATVSHELRTPLTSMKGALGLATSGAVGEVPEKMSGVINMAASNCDRLVVLINDILDLEKIEAGKMDYKMEVFDLNEMVAGTLESNQFYADKFGVRIRDVSRGGADARLTYGDPARLIQVMDNLMSNAAKFSHKGSEILVSVRAHQDRWRISIRDFGEGIPEKAQPTIFDKFTQADSSDTRSKGGTGLGLSIVKLIVEHHKGQIAFVSKPGVGTEFFVDLPMVVEGEVQPIARRSDATAMPKDFSDSLPDLAVISAADGNADLIERLLEKGREAGFRVQTEEGKVTALQLARGRGVVGQSSALSWAGAQERVLMEELMLREQMHNSDVAVIELIKSARGKQDTTLDAIAAGNLVRDWLAECSAELNGAAAPGAVVTIGAEDGLRDWMTDNGFVAAKDRGEAMAKLQDNQPDLIGQFGAGHGAGTFALFPLQNGKMPQGWPVLLIVVRTAAAKGGRGVVSKFSSGGGGRGRRRA